MLAPLDIENKKFSKQMMNGYNVEEIDDFLDDLTKDYTTLYKENAELKAQISEMKENVSHYKTIESTLQNTLVMAQTTADDIKKAATQQAEQIVRDAELNAKETITNLRAERITETKRYEDIKKQFDVYKAKMEALLISQLELLKESNSDFESTSYDESISTNEIENTENGIMSKSFEKVSATFDTSNSSINSVKDAVNNGYTKFGDSDRSFNNETFNNAFGGLATSAQGVENDGEGTYGVNSAFGMRYADSGNIDMPKSFKD